MRLKEKPYNIKEYTSTLVNPGDKVDLVAATNIFVPPLCCGVIPHLIRAVKASNTNMLMLVGIKGTLMSRTLLIEQGEVEDGSVLNTACFNISNTRIRIEKGEVISRLYGL